MLRKTRMRGSVLTRAARDRSGTVAIEFALTAPLLLITLIGGTEVTQAVMAAQKVATATRTMADLTSQIRGSTEMTGAMIDETFAAGRMILTPFPSGTLKVAISRVDVTSVNNKLVARTIWSATRNQGTARPCAVLTRVANTATPAPDSFPEGMHYASRFIVVDVTYTFSAPLTTNFAPTAMGFSGWATSDAGIEIKKTAYMQTRIDGAPTMKGAEACPVA